MHQAIKPILGFSAHSGTGKTTLIEKLIPQLKEVGIHIALIKHTHHTFDIDHEGKDSYRLRKAGAMQTLVASKNRWALMVETPQHKNEPNLPELIKQIDFQSIDLLLIEGFKHEPIPKIALHRIKHSKSLSFLSDPNVIAIATDDPILDTGRLPKLDINRIVDIRDFIVHFLAN